MSDLEHMAHVEPVAAPASTSGDRKASYRAKCSCGWASPTSTARRADAQEEAVTHAIGHNPKLTPRSPGRYGAYGGA